MVAKEYKSNEISKKSREELENCSFIKTILMIIVVIYHCILFWSGDWFSVTPKISNNVLPMIAKWLNTFHISGFTFISGYIYYYIRFEKNGYSNYVIYIKKKIRRLIVPYIFVAFLWVLPIGNIFFNYSYSDILFKIILGQSPGQLWFLLMLFNIFCVFPFLEKIVVKSWVNALIIISIFWGLSIVGKIWDCNYFQIITSFRFMSYFVVGFKIRQNNEKIHLNIFSVMILCAVQVILFVFLSVFNNRNEIQFKIIHIGLDFLVTQLGAIGVFFSLQIVAKKIKKRGKLCLFLQKSSMTIYLLHQQIIYFSIWFFNGHLNPYIHSVVNFIFALFVSSLLSYVLLKFKITSFMLGEKND